jgi:hypothetical protein
MTAWSKNVRGEMTDTPEENATVFQDFFNDLFRNDAEGGNVDEECAKMDQREVDASCVIAGSAHCNGGFEQI